MAYQQRRELISSLEQVTGSRVLSYILSDREAFPGPPPGLSTQIAGEPHIFIADQLKAIGKTDHISLFLYTRGGATDAVWPLICLLREYCEKLTVIVPFRAHSAGTLICLGADEIVMTELAELSPIDPTTGNQFNPSDPQNPQNRYGISVEDVAAYFELSEKRAGINQEPYKTEVFKELTQKVHPLALGNVQRVYMQIRRLALNLLALHLNHDTNGQKIDQIIKALTEEFYSHVHSISRREAITLLGDWVKQPSEEENQIIWDLFNSYADTLEIRKKLNFPVLMCDEPICDLTVIGGFIESALISHLHSTSLKVFQRPNLPSNFQIQVPPGSTVPLVPGFSRSFEFSIQKTGWEINEEGK